VNHKDCRKEPGRPGIPSCRCCGREINTIHLLQCHYYQHYGNVKPEDCDDLGSREESNVPPLN
jgi:hypothetical protein